MIENKASAKWSGGLKDGKGQLSTDSGVLNNEAYGFNQRFEGGRGTNPEELIGAAHAGCFSMALSNILGEHDLVAESIETTATVTMDPETLSITKVHLDLTARIPEASDEDFQEAAKAAKENCPVSKVLNADITMDAKLA